MESETVLPDDLVIEIFQHLPVKSLARFKCVSKNYKILISSRRFINTVLKRYPEPNNLLSSHCSGDIRQIILRSLNRVKRYNVPTDLGRSRVIGTYHGLICFSDCENSSALVWNPVTNQLRKFLFRRLPLGLFTSVGFGYDAINDDYKVVRISTKWREAYNLTIEIFELRNIGSRIINMPSVQVPFLLSNATPVTVNGSSHWIAFHPRNRILQIVRFDMDHEKFVEIPFSTDMPNINYDVDVGRRGVNPLTPEALASAQRLVINDKEFVLGVLDGFLCLFTKKMEAWSVNCKNHDGSDVEWTRLFEFFPIQTTEEEEAFASKTNNEVGTRNRIFINLEHQRQMLTTLLLCRHNHMHQPVAYVESLVNPWPQNINYDANVRGIKGLNLGGLALEGFDMDGKQFRLGVFKESLCLFISDSSKVEIWLMNRDNGHVVWTRMLEIPRSRRIEVVVGFTANEELIIRNANFDYFAYDPWKRRSIFPMGHYEIDILHQTLAYVESLVPVVP